MFETLRIKFFGKQPHAKISYKALNRIIRREFGDRENEAKQKLLANSEHSFAGRNRISAAIIKLANGDIDTIDGLLNEDFRDLFVRAEYPGCFGLPFSEGENKEKMKKIYLDDWKAYSSWLKKK